MISEITFIGVYATLSIVLAFALAPLVIRGLQRYGIKQSIREEAVDGKVATIFRELHAHKAGTPTMGGILIWGTVLLVVVLSRVFSYFGFGYGDEAQSLLQRTEVYLPLFTLVVMALLGLFDDWLNVKGVGKQKGLSAKMKMLWLILFGLVGALWFFYKLDITAIAIPFLGSFDLGVWYILLFILVIIATSNAVNITDGLDGLAGGLLAIAFSAYAVIAYFDGQIFLTAFCMVIAGSLLSFLWFNVAPARFYMGDTGALSLGATLGVVAMLTDTVVLLPIIGLIFVVEAASSTIQLLSKRFLGRKVFLIAPLHHHLEKIGWAESQIVMRFWLMGMVLAVIGVVFYLTSMIS